MPRFREKNRNPARIIHALIFDEQTCTALNKMQVIKEMNELCLLAGTFATFRSGLV